jgi:hypothetical protein
MPTRGSIWQPTTTSGSQSRLMTRSRGWIGPICTSSSWLVVRGSVDRTGTGRPTTACLMGRQVRLGRLGAGEQFVYEFDFGDSWAHLCTIAAERIDPVDQLGIVPDRPLPYWGWGLLPDQHGRHWDGGDADGPGRIPGCGICHRFARGGGDAFSLNQPFRHRAICCLMPVLASAFSSGS